MEKGETSNHIMQWHKLLSTKRFGLEKYHNLKHDARTEFQRDYDRLIFSAPFRRLQNKTQVFPLPGSVFVHNRLTHSLEVASVGRSLGNVVATALFERYQGTETAYFSEIGSIVAAACLAHDLGNPPFGHSGERAISAYFLEGNGAIFQSQLSSAEWADFIFFEGNANAFRLLTHQFEGRRAGGFVLTYSTLASIVKYPYQAQYAGKKSKFGFFQTEVSAYEQIASELGIIPHPFDKNRFARHPLVYLVEAADDICYQIMDIEDAFKLSILPADQTKHLLLSFLSEEYQRRAVEVFATVTDINEQIAYLRSTVIGTLIDACGQVFISNEAQLLQGTFQGTLIKQLSEPLNSAYKACADVAVNKIYCSQEVLDVELAGYKIISELIEAFVKAVSRPEHAYSKQLLMRIPSQYHTQSDSLYDRLQAVVDYISGMTDIYALDLYRKINGMSLPAL